MAKGLGVRRGVKIMPDRGDFQKTKRNKNILKHFKVFSNINFLIYVEYLEREDKHRYCLLQNI